jgi:rfaE bifunctional protein nucleotidyltransferase chain/domain/rfaE bifunctional protein kinase chain/domain
MTDKGDDPLTSRGWATHISELASALSAMDDRRLVAWGQELASTLPAGGRLLVAGNGGSAAEAQHLTAELAARHGVDRRPLSALALHADTSTVTALGNDVGFDEVFAHQVRAHGRAGDVLLVLSTSGSSENLLRAVEAARAVGLKTWALTASESSPLAQLCDEQVEAAGGSVAAIQECHLVALHLICAALDAALDPSPEDRPTPPSAGRQPKPPGRERGGARARLTIVGDVLLDRDLVGSVDRLAPEAPVPVLSSFRANQRPGGAGLCSMLAVADDFEVTLVTALGDDAEAGVLRQTFAEAGVRVVDLGTSGGTPVKTRVRTPQHLLVMLDEAEAPQSVGPLRADGRDALLTAEAIVVADYGRGVADSSDVRKAIGAVIGKVPVVWDPHPSGSPPVRGVDVVTPNSRETAQFVPEVAGRGLAGDLDRARRLLTMWDVGHVVVTRDREGAIILDDPYGAPFVVPPPYEANGDSCGAGDRLSVTLAALLAAGATPSDAVPQAVRAATAFVASGGRVESAPPEAAAGDAFTIAAETERRGGVVVATGGCFDLLHRGHIATLKAARALGDCLIVCLNGDASVGRIKGDGRPLVSAEDRAEILAGLAYVDAVVVFDEDTPSELLERLRPHVWVKGGDYTVDDISERDVVEAGGGHVVVVPYVAGRSTTSLIELAARRQAQTARSA